MFDRTYIKVMARARLSQGMGAAIAVALVAALLGGSVQGSSGPTFRFTWNVRMDWNNRLFLLLSMAFLIVLLLAILYSIFLGNVIGVGMRGWFLRYQRGQFPPVGEMFASFRIYIPSVATMLLRNLYVFLWSLLFIIPGIVKGYAYSMTEYILYENPNLPAGRAIEMSCILTDGAKGDLFVFDLSFILWDLLSVLTLGILSIVYVNPYKLTAHAGVYEDLKDRAIRSGRLTWTDFGQYPPPPAPPVYGYASY